MRPWMAGLALVAGTASLVACGDSSDGAKDSAAKTTAASVKPAASAAAPASSAAPASTTETIPKPPPDAPADVRAWSDAGTVRLAAIRIGTPGKLIVAPKGNVTDSKERGLERWYPLGTKITVKARDTKTARFAGWSGACTGTTRTCKLEMDNYVRLIGGFLLDAKGAKGLPKSSPALKPGTAGN